MNKLILSLAIATLSGGAYATQTNHGQQVPSPSQAQSAQSTSSSGALAGAAAISGSISGSSSTSSSNSLGVGEGGSSEASSNVGDTSATGGDSTSNSASGSDNTITYSHSDLRKYPDIPVNAGVTFAQVCQEGSSATNSRISIALTTDSVVCTHLRLADAFNTVMAGYAESCRKDADSQVADWRHKTLVASQVKGSVKVDPLVVTPSSSCTKADEFQEMMLHELKQAQSASDKTHGTGIFAKWATQLGIPVSLIAALAMVL